MNTLIKQALIITMTGEEHAFVGDIGITDGSIAFVGNPTANFLPDTVIDAQGMIAMPALVNAHTHLSMEYMRNYKDTCANLHQWLSQIFPIEDKLTAKDIRIVSELGVAELIRSGVTTFADMYFFADETAQVVIDSGIRACLGLTLFGDLEESKKRVQERHAPMTSLAERSNGRIRVDIAPHAIYTTTADSYRYAHDYAKDNGVFLHTHVSETRQEVEDSIKEFGTTPGLYLEQLGCFEDIHSYLAHCVHLSELEMEHFSHQNIGIVHNPTSNCKLASGIAPISKIRKHGIALALGTDGSSSNNNLNMFEEMHVASLISTVSTFDTLSLPPYEALKMATIGGAQVLGLEKTIGTLEPGKDADLILIDMQKSHLVPMNNPFSALVYGAQASDVDTVFCKGKLIMQQRKLLTIDERLAMIRTQEQWKDILNRP